MNWVEVAGEILRGLIWIGVVWLAASTVKGLFDKWLKREALKQRLDRMAKRFSEDARDTELILQAQEEEISSLKKQVEQLSNTAGQLADKSKSSMSELVEIARQIVSYNEMFYEKLKKVNRWMEQEKLTPEFRKELLGMLQDDVSFKQEYEATLDQYVKEQEERVRRRVIDRGREHGWEPEL